jgi:hypothetical protein
MESLRQNFIDRTARRPDPKSYTPRHLAEQMLQKSVEAFRTLNIPYMTAHVLASLAQCQEKMNKIQDAEANLREAKVLYENMGLPALIDFF